MENNLYKALKVHCVVDPGADPNNALTKEEEEIGATLLNSLSALDSSASDETKIAWLWNELDKLGILNDGKSAFPIPAKDDHGLLDKLREMGIINSECTVDHHREEMIEDIATKINEKIDLPLASEEEEQKFFEQAVEEALPVIDDSSNEHEDGEDDQSPREVDSEEEHGSDIHNH